MSSAKLHLYADDSILYGVGSSLKTTTNCLSAAGGIIMQFKVGS